MQFRTRKQALHAFIKVDHGILKNFEQKSLMVLRALPLRSSQQQANIRHVQGSISMEFHVPTLADPLTGDKIDKYFFSKPRLLFNFSDKLVNKGFVLTNNPFDPDISQ